ncbi:DUF927 domain-containing protein [Paraburkholderia sp. CNPSo 3272]|uniref:DUF927 domain-containing protein n=1 Tax=Paraburkholderia sp. CNPSo 3272 TaxID=2940931 RepID=UPI0035CD243B
MYARLQGRTARRVGARTRQKWRCYRLAGAIAFRQWTRPRVPKPPPAYQADGEEAGVDNGDREAGGTPPGFAVRDDGLFYEDDDGVAHRICSPLRVTALVRDASSENWGRLLEWHDAEGVPHRWAMPLETARRRRCGHARRTRTPGSRHCARHAHPPATC